MNKLVCGVVFPVDELAQVLAPELLKLMRDAEGAPTRSPRSRVSAVDQGARNVARALTRYENAAGSRDERPALAGLIAASKGLRRALQADKNPIQVKE
ncbi:hypothetical protein STOPSMEL_13 [Sinorhizobium phage StopSmel]|nr:hypothetical protein STOPSMEL_13 [Sinorhizobium phage StopSmel]